MDDQQYVYATAALIAAYFVSQVATRRFDPFAPVWLFLVGYVQVYVIQATSYRSWATTVHSLDHIAAANFRALWALAWFLLVYHLGLGRPISRALPRPPTALPDWLVLTLSPFLVVWGLYCTSLFGAAVAATAGDVFLRSFPFVMLVGATLLITTGRRPDAPKPAFLYAGLIVAFVFVMIWMFNAKRSLSLMGVLVSVCAFYTARQRRPSWGVLAATAFSGAMVVAVAIGWRNNPNYERSFSGFVDYLGDFDPSKILESLDIAEEAELVGPMASYETKEYGGFLLMLDATPEKSDYDYGANYLRTFSTFIPRMFWHDKPLYGRQQWVEAWIASSEFKRDETFTGPAIGILGAAQLNGGTIGTLIVLAAVALFLRTCYDYFLLHPRSTWAQFAWSVFFFNAWFMVVNDDPMIWFYFNWGFCGMPFVTLTWIFGRRDAPAPDLGFEAEEPAAVDAGSWGEPFPAVRSDRRRRLDAVEPSARDLLSASPSFSGEDRPWTRDRRP